MYNPPPIEVVLLTKTELSVNHVPTTQEREGCLFRASAVSYSHPLNIQPDKRLNMESRWNRFAEYLYPRTKPYQGQVGHIADGHHTVQVVLSFQEEEPAVVGEVGVVGIVLQGVTWGVTRRTLSRKRNRGLHIEHLRDLQSETMS